MKYLTRRLKRKIFVKYVYAPNFVKIIFASLLSIFVAYILSIVTKIIENLINSL